MRSEFVDKFNHDEDAANYDRTRITPFEQVMRLSFDGYLARLIVMAVAIYLNWVLAPETLLRSWLVLNAGCVWMYQRSCWIWQKTNWRDCLELILLKPIYWSISIP